MLTLSQSFDIFAAHLICVCVLLIQSNLNLSRYSLLSQSMTDICRSTDNLTLNTSEDYEAKYAELLQQLEDKR